VLQVAIDRGVHGDGANAERMTCAQDSERNLAAIRDDDFIEQFVSPGVMPAKAGTQFRKSKWIPALAGMTVAYPITNIGSSNSTGCAFETSTASTVPATSASIWLNIFIASMIPSVSPALTFWPIFTNGGDSGFDEA